MKIAVQNQQISTNRLTGLYVTALGAIALLAILGQIFIQISLLQQSSDALVINIAGRQRMLSQKLSKAALAIQVATDSTQRNERVEELKDTVTLWQRSHQGLQQGDVQLGLPGNNSETVRRLFMNIEPNFTAMLTAAKLLLARVDIDQNRSPAVLSADISPFVQTILAQESGFLVGMDAIVSQYQSEAEGRVTQLKVIELILLCLTLLVLVLEGVLVFRPAIRRLGKSAASLVEAEKQIRAAMEDLEHKNADLELAFSEAVAAHRKVMPHARVVAFGHYQVQGSQGHYFNVTNHEMNGNLVLECECLMYARNLICSHSLAAAALHSALIRNQQQPQHQTQPPAPRRINFSSPDYRSQFSG